MRRWRRNLQRDDQRNERGSSVTPPASALTPAASTSHEVTETTIELDPNSKKRLLVKSASSAASGSGQQHVKRSTTDAELTAPIEVSMEMGTDRRAALPSAMAAITRRRIAVKSEPVAVATHTRNSLVP